MTILKKVADLNELLHSGDEMAVMHCAAGVHRTGTIAYALLRINGYSPDEAMERIGMMRMATFKGVGEWRIKLSEDLIVK